MKDEKKICFIICSNNTQMLNECVYYINHLNIPDHYSIEIKVIENAVSMTSGYNEAMRSSNAKYKIYLHQDVFILNKNLLYDVLKIFQNDDKVGMIGVVGGISLPGNGVFYDQWNCGRLIACEYSEIFDTILEQVNPFIEVEAIDGLFMITQHDIPWREDLFQDWDFYDVSQSFEFRKKGYKVIIPFQNNAWCMHDNGGLDLRNYEKNRKIFCREYQNMLPLYEDRKILSRNKDLDTIKSQLYLMISTGKWEYAAMFIDKFVKLGIKDAHLKRVENILNIYKKEEEYLNKVLFKNNVCWEDIQLEYNRIKYMMLRIDNSYIDDEVMSFVLEVKNKLISAHCISVIASEAIVHEDTIEKFLKLFGSNIIKK